MKDTVDGINEKAWDRAMARQERCVYVLMFRGTLTGSTEPERVRDLVQTLHTKRDAISLAKRVGATVYAVPLSFWHGTGAKYGVDSPTIRATFDPIVIKGVAV